MDLVDPDAKLCKLQAMNHAKLFAAIALMAPLAACQTAPQIPAIASARLLFADGRPAGAAAILNDSGQVTIRLSVAGISPGDHGLHLHTTGSCTAPDFQSAGGHLNPHSKQHGMHNPMGSHLGDLPNLTADANGNAQLSAAVSGEPEALRSILFDADGTAIVIHANADDMVSDPAGNSGKRIVCGVLTPGG